MQSERGFVTKGGPECYHYASHVLHILSVFKNNSFPTIKVNSKLKVTGIKHPKLVDSIQALHIKFRTKVNFFH